MKKPYKVMMLSAIIAAMTAGSVTPTYAAATQVQVQQQQSASDANIIDITDLTSADLLAKLQGAGSNVLKMDIYALTVTKQSVTNLSNIASLDATLKSKLVTDQTTAKSNAKYWLDNLRPEMVKVNEGIINYDTQFQSYYDEMVAAAKAKDKATFKEGLQDLKTSVHENQVKTQELIKKLQDYKTKLAADTQNFKTNANSLTAHLDGQDSSIKTLEREITATTDAIDKDIGIIAGGAVTTVVGIGLVVAGGITIAVTAGAGTAVGAALVVGGIAVAGGGIGLIAYASDDLVKSRNNLSKITQELSAAKSDYLVVTNAKNQIDYLTQTIDAAITALQNISNQWSTIDAKYDSLNTNVDKISPDSLSFITSKLATAKASWGDLRAYAERMYQDIQYTK